MRNRALLVAAVVVVAVLGASVAAYFAQSGSGSASTAGWKTAAGVSLQVPTTGAPKLAFTAQPPPGARIQANGGTFAVSVAIQDSHGTTVSSDSSDTVTLAIGHNSGGGVLHCASARGLTVTVSSGMANFTGCAISKAGAGYTLTASSSVKPALAAPGNAHAFDVVSGAGGKTAGANSSRRRSPSAARNRGAGAVHHPGPSGVPGGPGAGETLSITSPAITGAATPSPTLGPITVQLRTAGGAPVTTGLTVGLSSSSTGSSEFSATRGGAPVTSVSIPRGSSVATFYYGDERAGAPVITVAAAGVTPGMQPETINAGAAAGLSFIDVATGTAKGSDDPAVTCAGTVGAGSFACRLSPGAASGTGRFMTAQVTLVDQFQNVVTGTSGPAIKVSLSQTGGTSVSAASVTIAAGSSSSAPFTENLADGAGQGTVSATATVSSAQVAATLTS